MLDNLVNRIQRKKTLSNKYNIKNYQDTAQDIYPQNWYQLEDVDKWHHERKPQLGITNNTASDGHNSKLAGVPSSNRVKEYYQL